MLRIPLDKIQTVIALAREALGQCPDEEAVPTNGSDGQPLPSSEDYDQDVAFDALFDYVDALNGDELADLLALSWLGQDGSAADWPTTQAVAEDEIADGDGLAEFLQNPTLPDDLEAGLEVLGDGGD